MGFNDPNLRVDPVPQPSMAFEAVRGVMYVLDPDKRPEESQQLEWLKEDSGYVLKQVGRGPDQESEEERKERETRKDIQQNAVVAGLSMTMAEVHENLGKGFDLLTQAANRELPEMKKEDFLYVDQRGNVVPANHPGARQVETVEEKAAIEEEQKMCLIGATADQATIVNGRLVSAESVLAQEAMQANAEDLREWQERIAAGTAKIEDAPEHVQDQVREIEETGTLKIAQEPIATINGVEMLLPAADIARYEAQQRYTAPAPGMTPTPPGM